MSVQRIILANSSRLLREMWKRILLKTRHVEIVQEVTDQDKLPAAIEKREAEWVVISLPMDSPMPGWMDVYMKEHPHTQIMAFSSDGRWVKMKRMERHEEDISDLSLQELIRILEGTSERD
ncbi:MAG: hypothetical protein HYZ21_04455 [Chloroflexi bacterium]|nr:hypothetical protein [Chloroflexota bacterium]